MLRRTLTILSLLGLLLSVGLWGASYLTIWHVAPKHSLLLSSGAVAYVHRWQAVEVDESEGLWHFFGYRGLQTEWIPRARPRRDPTKPASFNNPEKVCFVFLGPAYFRIMMPLWIPTILLTLARISHQADPFAFLDRF